MGGLLDIALTPEIQEVIAQILTQILAFVILVWGLKRFAWKPIVSMLDERREKIATEFERIDSMELQVKELREEYENRIRNIEGEARIKIQEAIREGRRIAREITDIAREEAESILGRARQSIEIQVHTASTQVRDEIIEMVILATKHLLHERLDELKQRELISRFINELEQEK